MSYWETGAEPLSPEGRRVPFTNEGDETLLLETTNWNAVKLLAAKHGIQLGSYEEEVEQRCGAKAAVDGLNEDANGKGAGGDAKNETQAPQIAADEDEGRLDLGAGTPFCITAQTIQRGSRHIFRFTERQRQVASHVVPPTLSVAPEGPSLDTIPPSRFDAQLSLGEPINLSQQKSNHADGGLLADQGIEATAKSSKHATFAAKASPSRGKKLKKSSSSAFLRAMGVPLRHNNGSTIPQQADASSSKHVTPTAQPTQAQAWQPYATSQQSFSQETLRGGDVLSAILGLQSVPCAALPSQSPASQASSISEISIDHGATRRPKGSSERAFGQLVAVRAPPLASTSERDTSHIPRAGHIGEPLFKDMPFMQPERSSHAEPASTNLLQVPSSTDDQARHVRGMKSFESTASAQTATMEDGRPREFATFDTFQTFGRRDRPRRMSAGSWSSSLSSTSLSASYESMFENRHGGSSSGTSTAHDMSTSAAAGDDPRFVLWAKVEKTETGRGHVLLLCDRWGRVDDDSAVRENLASRGRENSTGTGPPSPIASASPNATTPSRKKRNSLRLDSSSPKVTSPASPRSHRSSKPRKSRYEVQLLAATRARLVAELTSEIDSRLLSDFFYTFRAFMTTRQLLNLLINRFQWALEEPKTPQDEALRRIVRVRTYVVIKTWLSTFFEADFLRDRTLRTALTTWLNALSADPRLPERPADLTIVKSLRKIVRGLKHAYTHTGVSSLLSNEPGRRVPSTANTSTSSESEHSVPAEGDADATSLPRSPALEEVPALAEHEQISDAQGRPPITPDEAPDASAWSSLPHEPVSTHAAPSTSWPIADEMEDADETLSPDDLALPHLPSNNSTFSRAFVNTVGRFSRFKRHLGSTGQHGLGRDAIGQASSSALSGDSTTASVEEAGGTSEPRDLLFAQGGIDEVKRFFGLDESANDETAAATAPGRVSGVSDEAGNAQRTPSLDTATSDPTNSTPASSVNEREEGTPNKGGSYVAHGAALAEYGLGIHNADVPRDTDEKTPAAFISGLASNFDMVPKGPALVKATSDEPVHTADASQANVHHAASNATLRLSESAENGAEAESAVSPAAAASSSSSSSQSHAPPAWAQAALGPPLQIGQPTSLPFGASAHSSLSLQQRRASGPNIVQIDDIDFSSDEDDGAVRRALRRLPGARDLRMANNLNDLYRYSNGQATNRQSFDSLSSLGQVYQNRGSVPSLYPGSSSLGRTSGLQAARFVDLFDPDEALIGFELVRGFRAEDFASDDEEPGDVQEALRRLEGIIDDDKKEARAKRVQALWEQSRAREALNLQGQQFDDGNDDNGDISNAASADRSHASDVQRASVVSKARSNGRRASVASNSRSIQVPPPAATIRPRSRAATGAHLSSSPPHTLPPTVTSSNGRPAIPETWARALLAHQLMSSGHGVPRQQQDQQWIPARSVGLAPPLHRSFLLEYKSDLIAQQFSLIEAELVRSVTWRELAGAGWKRREHSSEVLDWQAFYQARVRSKAAHNASTHSRPHLPAEAESGAVEAIVARFNLTCNWVASEIVLTRSLDDRAALVCKLIRVAWRCYQQSNFATLVQICLGLQSPWVERLRRTWSRVGMWEMRILRDLKILTSPSNNFRHLRTVMRARINESGLEDLVSSSGPPPTPRRAATGGSKNSGTKATSRGCVPFFGLFISDLALNDVLPTFVDPSSPNHAADATANGDARLRRPLAPSAFDSLPQLPKSVPLEAMVNWSKFRETSRLIKTVLAFQVQAGEYSYEAHAEAYVKCLKIRCLQGFELTRISHFAEP